MDDLDSVVRRWYAVRLCDLRSGLRTAEELEGKLDGMLGGIKEGTRLALDQFKLEREPTC